MVVTSPSKVNFKVNQKSSFLQKLYVLSAADSNTAIDLSTWTTAAGYKENYLDPDPDSVPISAAITNAVAGEITLTMTPAETTELEIQLAYVYDVTITNTLNNYKLRVLEGKLLISPGIS